MNLSLNKSKLYVLYNTVLVECTNSVNGNKSNQKTEESKDEEDCSVEKTNDLNFLNGIIYLNPVLQPTVRYRLPRYSYERFANSCDIVNAFPWVKDAETILKLLKSPISNKPLSDPIIHRIKEATTMRIKQFAAVPTNLKSCTPWLSKEKPLSAEESLKSPLKGKIYATVVTMHSAEDDLLVVQETETDVGYMPPVFSAEATVAFPPICKGEVWTVGWIQAMKKAKRTTFYDPNLM